MRIAVAGGTGVIGARLVDVLAAAGHDVVVMSRHPERWRGPGRAIRGDVRRQETLPGLLVRADVAVYLVHLLGSASLVEAERAAARAFGAAAHRAGVRRIVYLGGLADGDAAHSDHMRARLDTEAELGAAGVPVTALRAGMVVGPGSLSWELLVRVVDRFPVHVGSTWVDHRCQPVALDDVVTVLAQAVEGELGPGSIEVGGPDVLTYREMLDRVGRLRGQRRPFVLYVPSALPWVGGALAAALTGLPPLPVSHLIESLRHDAVVTGRAGDVVITATGFDAAARAALAE